MLNCGADKLLSARMVIVLKTTSTTVPAMARKTIVVLLVLMLLLSVPLTGGYTIPADIKGWVGCISHYETNAILKYKDQALLAPQTVECSVDLNVSKRKISLNCDGLSFNGQDVLATWEEIERISKKASGCYVLYDDGTVPTLVSTLSETTGMPASLCPPLDKAGAPTMVLGGFTMHRISGDNINPTVDTEAKLSSVTIRSNARVLDTCMGLGYTAIAAGRMLDSSAGGKVTTIEFDEASLEVASQNPWSAQLFDGSLPIEIMQGDSCKIVKGFKNGSFDVIIHDPPARAVCKTDLYSAEFYSDLRRILTRKGLLFHYIGNPTSKESGRLYRGIMDRLNSVGFTNVKKYEKAFGVIATNS